MMMSNQMMMMMELCRVIILVVPRAQFEDMAECREEEQQELQEHLFGSCDAHDERQYED